MSTETSEMKYATDTEHSVENGWTHPTRRAAVLMIGWRAALVVGAAVATTGPVELALPLVTAAVITVAEWGARYRRRGVVDALVSAIAATVGTAVVLGLVLNLFPVGLTRAAWAIGGAVVGLLVLVIGGLVGSTPSIRRQWLDSGALEADSALAPAADESSARNRRSAGIVNIACTVLAVAVVTAALLFAGESANSIRIAPLEMSASTTGPTVEVSINSGTAAGPFDLVVVTDQLTATVATGIQIDNTNTVVVQVSVSETGRTLLQLVPSGQATPVRELIFDGGVLGEVPLP